MFMIKRQPQLVLSGDGEFYHLVKHYRVLWRESYNIVHIPVSHWDSFSKEQRRAAKRYICKLSKYMVIDGYLRLLGIKLKCFQVSSFAHTYHPDDKPLALRFIMNVGFRL